MKEITPHDLWRSWTFEPVVVLLLLASAAWYWWGVRRVWTASETGAGVRVWRALSFAAGWVAQSVRPVRATTADFSPS